MKRFALLACFSIVALLAFDNDANARPRLFGGAGGGCSGGGSSGNAAMGGNYANYSFPMQYQVQCNNGSCQVVPAATAAVVPEVLPSKLMEIRLDNNDILSTSTNNLIASMEDDSAVDRLCTAMDATHLIAAMRSGCPCGANCPVGCICGCESSGVAEHAKR